MSGETIRDFLLGKPRHDGEQRPVRVGSLRGEVQRGLAGDGVDVGHDAAGLQRRRVRARVVRLQRDDPGGAREGRVGGLGVTALPGVDQVVGLALLLVADQRGVGGQRLLGAGHGRQHLVVHLDEGGRVGGDVRVGSDHRRHLLALVAHLVGGEHRLGVARQRGHPGQVVGGHQLAGDDSDDPLDGGRRRGVDAADAGVRHRGSVDGHVQHPRQDHVVEEVALTLDEPVVLLPEHAVPDAADLRRGGEFVGSGHCALLSAAAA